MTKLDIGRQRCLSMFCILSLCIMSRSQDDSTVFERSPENL